jgi:hypothetical protein
VRNPLRRKRPTPEKPTPEKPRIDITDTERFDHLAKSGVTREAVDTALLTDEQFVRRKEFDAAITALEVSSYSRSFSIYGYEANQRQRTKAVATLKRLAGIL